VLISSMTIVFIQFKIEKKIGNSNLCTLILVMFVLCTLEGIAIGVSKLSALCSLLML